MGGLTVGEPVVDEQRRAVGEAVVLREIWRHRVWSARPAIVVSDEPESRMFHIPNGVRGRWPVDAGGRYLKIPTADWTLAESIWEEGWALSFAFPDVPYAVILGFDQSDRFTGYYVNLESPLVPTQVGFDYVEYLLDVEIAPDRSMWTWKDEDELAEAVARGLFPPNDAEWFHHWGERAVEHVLLGEPPFDQDWSTWRPDPSWGLPELPAGWDTAPVGRGIVSPG
jgi:hypothetical protein